MEQTLSPNIKNSEIMKELDTFYYIKKKDCSFFKNHNQKKKKIRSKRQKKKSKYPDTKILITTFWGN